MNSENNLIKRLKEKIKLLESKGGKPELKAYKPDEKEEYWTIGHGHYGKDVKKGDTITEEKAEELLESDIKDRLKLIRLEFPTYDTMRDEMQEEIMSGWFRGDMARSPKGSPATQEKIRAKDYEGAAKEFLDHKEYKQLKKSGKLPGVVKRLESISNEFQKESDIQNALKAMRRHGIQRDVTELSDKELEEELLEEMAKIKDLR